MPDDLCTAVVEDCLVVTEIDDKELVINIEGKGVPLFLIGVSEPHVRRPHLSKVTIQVQLTPTLHLLTIRPSKIFSHEFDCFGL